MDQESGTIFQIKKKFPWKIVRRFLLHQILFSIFLMIVAGFAIRYSAHQIFEFDYQSAPKVAEFDRSLTALLWFLVGLFVLHSFYTAWLFLGPLGRLLQKARMVRKKTFDGDAELDFFDREEPGEWDELDRALNRIKKTLDKKRRQYNREREELEAIVSSVKNAIVVIDQQHNVRYYNSQFAVLFKRKRKQDIGRRIEEIFRDPPLLESFKAALTGENPSDLTLALMTSRHKLPRNFSIAMSPLRNKDDGSVYGAVAILHDVTESKVAEQIRMDFVANASHELRTPLTSVHGYLQTLKEDLGTGNLQDADRFVDIVLRNVERLKELVTDLLDLSTLESGAEIQQDSEDPRMITENVLNQLDRLRSEKEILILTKYDIQDIFGDGKKIEQVLINLLHNSLKYIPNGSRVEVKWTQDEPNYKKLIVRDDGPGIPLEHQERLFERFYRVDKGRDRKVSGTGLGLSIVKHIMMKHGGDVSLKSNSETGTQFTCKFPVKIDSEVKGDLRI